MKKHISFPSIEQFRNVITTINRTYNYIGQDENNEPVFDHSIKKPVLTFTGTVKIHGTNASVCKNDINGMWVQSRENIITPLQDNAGFAMFVEANKQVFDSMFDEIKNRLNLDLSKNTIAIYGEYAGGNIQKGVAITNLPKSMFIFGVKITPFSNTENQEEFNKKNPSYWVDYSYLKSPEHKIYNVDDFKKFEIEIDFNMPELVQNKLAELTIEVENECPVAKAFGFSGIGEGIVWTSTFKNNRLLFKTKGEKHSSSKVRTIASVDVDKLNSIKEFVDYSVTESRFNQAIEKTFTDGVIDIKRIGDVIRWVVNDIIKEEMDTMISNKLEVKDVTKYIPVKVREMFFKLT